MVEQQPKEESGIEFDLDSAQAANEAAEAAAKEASGEVEDKANAGAATASDTPAEKSKPSALSKFLADDGLFMRFVWWTLRTTASLAVPLGIFYAIENCEPLVSGAYKMLNPGTNPYTLLMKGGLSQFMAVLIAGAPMFLGWWLSELLAKFKSWKPIIRVAIWCVLMFPVTLVFVVIARYFHIV